MVVKDDAVAGEIKREILPRLTRSDSYSTYCGDKSVEIVCHPPEPAEASLTDNRSPSVTEQLIQRFGSSKPPQPPVCFEMPSAYLLWPASTYGEESQWQEVAQFFVSLMREARLDDGLSMEYQGVKEDSTIFLSIDVDFALRCPECRKPLDLGHVYHALGTDLAGAYTALDAFCPSCDLKRTIDSLPPAVISIHDKISPKFVVSSNKRTQLVIRASDWMQKEQVRQRNNRTFGELH